jgi:hypothetical protein
MRVVINQALIDRYRRLSHILFFVSLAGMGIGFFYTWTSNPNSQTSQFSCLILPILLLMTLTSVRMANTWIREPHPVPALSEALKGLGKKYSIFHHILPAPHVLIGPEGVFTITTVWQERAYRVKGKKWYGEEGLIRKLNGYMRQDLLGNPFQNALLEAEQMQKLVNKIAPDSGVEVQPLVQKKAVSTRLPARRKIREPSHAQRRTIGFDRRTVRFGHAAGDRREFGSGA